MPRDSGTTVLNPFPDHRDLYVLVAGLLLGVLLGPAVLGQLAPGAYGRLFVGAGPATQAIHQLQAERERVIADLESTGVSGAAVVEQMAAYDRQLEQLDQQAMFERAMHDRRLAGLLTAAILAMIGVMVVEALVSPSAKPGRRTVPRALSRLVTVRYALIALWLALVLARPALLGQVPVLFAALLVAVALVVAFVPLGKPAEAG